MVLEQGIAARLFHSQPLKTRGLLSLFEELRQLRVQCEEPESNMVVDPVQHYQANPAEDFYFLSVESHEVIMSINRKRGNLFLGASLDYVQDERNEDLIQVVSKLVDALFPAFVFTFAYVDLEGDPPPKLSEDVEAIRIKWLFWANYFGKAYVDKFGKDFLLHAPGWRSEEMPNGTVKYLTRLSPRVKLEPKAKRAITAYFGREHRVEIYSWERFGFI